MRVVKLREVLTSTAIVDAESAGQTHSHPGLTCLVAANCLSIKAVGDITISTLDSGTAKDQGPADYGSGTCNGAVEILPIHNIQKLDML
jgi:hypothetical protein